MTAAQSDIQCNAPRLHLPSTPQEPIPMILLSSSISSEDAIAAVRTAACSLLSQRVLLSVHGRPLEGAFNFYVIQLQVNKRHRICLRRGSPELDQRQLNQMPTFRTHPYVAIPPHHVFPCSFATAEHRTPKPMLRISLRLHVEATPQPAPPAWTRRSFIKTEAPQHTLPLYTFSRSPV